MWAGSVRVGAGVRVRVRNHDDRLGNLLLSFSVVSFLRFFKGPAMAVTPPGPRFMPGSFQRNK